jgi:hypothetical protein
MVGKQSQTPLAPKGEKKKGPHECMLSHWLPEIIIPKIVQSPFVCSLFLIIIII